MHKIIELLLVLVMGALFILVVRYRPNGQPLSKSKKVGLFIVGAIIGVIFITTHSLYATTSGL